jgi:uncharacterized CHY-type Zn-finger protein/rhodanese-related sulfurtransferase
VTRPQVHGVEVDSQTRCAHYHSALDIVAIKMKCCATYFSCKDCHAALSDHPLEPWPLETRRQKAVLCGACGAELTIQAYLESSERCPSCGARFNPRCRDHHADYFAADAAVCERMGDVRSITSDQLKRRLGGATAPFMLDVREPEEMADGVIPGSVNIPMDEVEARLGELPADREIVVICHMGVRSAFIAKRLKALGYDRVTNLSGGVNGWLQQSGRSTTGEAG